ncbi:aminotransferase class IV [Hyphobacterium sp.]|jgi:branched-subunit amino acid aminotransferase/4-amino-4-deoxychorismate lyase|uniref:aminotransferase class IV n=1 Tax=Hyphobacterium sp. TaxID=2004662 RepID=UPI003BAAF609
MYRLEPTRWQKIRTGDVVNGDRGFLLGDGVFETFRIEAGSIRNSRLHAASLAASCEALDLECPAWDSVEQGVADHSGPADGVGKMIVTRGVGPRGLAPIAEQRPQIYLDLSPRPNLPRGLRLASVPIRRSPTSLTARFKTLSYADNLAARRAAAGAGADMALLTTTDGEVSGGDSANLFWLAGGEVFTPSADCAIRRGIMRQRVIVWLKRQGYAVNEVRARPERLDSAEAVWMTNAVMGAIPVTAIDSRLFDANHALLSQLAAADL